MADDPRPSPSFCRALRDFTSTDASSLSFRKNDVVQIVNRLDSGWWDGILGEVRGWFPSNYVAMISNPKSEELRRVSGASLQMHTLHDKTEQVVAKNGMKKRSHSDNDRLRLRLDRLGSSDSISNTLQFVKPLEPKTAEFLEPALMPARQVSDGNSVCVKRYLHRRYTAWVQIPARRYSIQLNKRQGAAEMIP